MARLRLAWLLGFLLLPALCAGQAYTTITASGVTVDNGSGTAVNPPSGSSLCFLGVNRNGAAITYTPSGGSPVSSAVCGTFTTGGNLSSSFQVANPATASPAGLCYTITIVNGGTTYLSIPIVCTVTGTVWAFNSYALPGSGTAAGIGFAHIGCANGAQWTSTTLPPGQNAQTCSIAGSWVGYPPNPYCPAGQAYLVPQGGGQPFCTSPTYSGNGAPSGACIQNTTYYQQDSAAIWYCKAGAWVENAGGGGGGLPSGGVNGQAVVNSGVAGSGVWQSPIIGTANGGAVITSPYALQCDSSTAATGIIDRGKWAVVGSGGSVVIPDLSGTNCGGFYGGVANDTSGNITVSRQTSDTFTVYGPISGLPATSQTSFTVPAGSWAMFEPSPGSTTAYDVRIASVPASTTLTRSCEIVVVGTNGSGNTAVLQAGDDAAFNASCLNETQTTWTVIGVYCWGDSASNTTTVSPTEGSAGTGSSLLSTALTCGSSKVPAAGSLNGTPTIANGASVAPVMGGTLTGTNIHVLIVYTAVLPL